MPIPRTLDQDFFKTWSPDMAYVLGYFAADGSMLRNNRGAHFVEFTSIDKRLILQVRRVCCSNHHISTRVRAALQKPAYRIQFGSKEWFSDLSRLGFTQNKSKTVVFPDVPRKYVGDFVRGYFDGDGCVYFGRHWSKWHKKERWVFTTIFTSGSKKFLNKLHSCLKSFGISGGYVNKKDQAFDLVFSRYDSLALYKLMYHTARTSNLFLPRKREKLERALKILGLDK